MKISEALQSPLWKRVRFAIITTILFSLGNLLLSEGFFLEGSEYFDSHGYFIGILAVIMFSILIILSIRTALLVESSKITVGRALLTLWCPHAIIISTQMLLFCIYNALSKYFDMQWFKMFLIWLWMCVVILAWSAMCLFLCRGLKSTAWYFSGFIVINIAPCVIADFCFKIYNADPIFENISVPFIWADPFIAAISPNGLVIYAIITLVLILIYKWLGNKIFILCRAAIVFIASLSVGFLVSQFLNENAVSFGGALVSFLVCIMVAILLSVFAFLNKKQIYVISTVLITAICSLVISFGILMVSSRIANYNAKQDNIQQIKITEAHL